MASINVDQKGRELWRASANGKKDEVKAMIKALSPREEWTQVLNWQNVSTANTRVQETRDFERGSEGQFLRAILEVRWPTWGFLAPIPS